MLFYFFQIGIHSAMLYDAVYLYALGLNAVFWQGLDERNGTQIISELVNHTFHGMLPTYLPTYYLPTRFHFEYIQHNQNVCLTYLSETLCSQSSTKIMLHEQKKKSKLVL